MKKITMMLTMAGVILTLLGAAAAQSSDPIDSIRQHYAKINQNVKLYRRVKRNLSGFSAEGGELIAYFHGPTVMKMTATFFANVRATIVYT